MKFVILVIFAIFVAQSFHIAWKILVTFAIFAKFWDLLKPFLTFSVSKCRILWNCYSCYFCHICCSIFSRSRKNSCYFCDFFKIGGLLEALLDLLSFLTFARQQFLLILVTLANLWHFAIFRGSPCPFLFVSVEFCEICCSCHFCHICCSIFSRRKKNSC